MAMLQANIGKLRHRIRLLVPVREADEYGGQAKVETVKDLVWANLVPITASEAYRYLQLQKNVTHKAVIRYRSDVQQGWAVKDQDNVEYYVVAATNPDRRKRFLELVLREGGNL